VSPLLTADFVSEGRRLHSLLELAIDTDDDVMQARHRLALQLWLGAAMQEGLFDLLEKGLLIAKSVAKLDTFEPDSGWPMGQACRTCRGFGAYTMSIEDAPQPDTGSPEAEWEAYRVFMAKRDAEAVAAIQHEDDCAWVAARALLKGGHDVPG